MSAASVAVLFGFLRLRKLAVPFRCAYKVLLVFVVTEEHLPVSEGSPEHAWTRICTAIPGASVRLAKGTMHSIVEVFAA